MADSLAKLSLDLNSLNRKVCFDDMKSLVKQNVNFKWNLYWKSQTNNKLLTIKPNTKAWKCLDLLHKKDATIITRLRIGHTNITHSHLMDQTGAPECNCGHEGTVKHIFECHLLRENRENCQISNFMDLSVDNYDVMKNILKYIRQIGIYYEI
jgi:hypothetical protein